MYRELTITVESNGNVFNTWTDWHLRIQNFDCIGDPEQQTSFVTVPGSNVQIDMSEALTGRPVFKSREINVKLSGVAGKYDWSALYSSMRNNIEGRVCRLQFSDDAAYFWRGRVHIENTDSFIGVGSFELSVPEAEPYKYDVLSSSDAWLWDPFNFETGVIYSLTAIEVDGSETVKLPKGHMPVAPEFVCSDIASSGSLTVSNGTYTKTLRNGSNKDPRIVVNGESEVTLTFTGAGTVEIEYRGGSL